MNFRVTDAPLSHERVKEIAALHRQAIPRGFFSSLGSAALEVYYAGAKASPGGVLLVAEEEASGRLLGFVSAAADARAFQSGLLRRLPRASLKLLPALLKTCFSPAAWRKLRDLMFYPRSVEQTQPALPAAELLSLAVSADCRRQGVARALYQGLLEEFARRGVPAFRILVGGELAEAQKFYAAQGATLVGDWELHVGQRSLIYVQAVSDAPEAKSRAARSEQQREARLP